MSTGTPGEIVVEVRQRPRRLKHWGWVLLANVILFAIGVIALIAVDLIERRNLRATVRAGDEIVDALEGYRATEGRYPQSLEELIPKYLSSIPAARWGLKTWQYSANGNEFSLQVNESTKTGDGNAQWLQYLGPKSGWQMGD
jgi:hypothetical protein